MKYLVYIFVLSNGIIHCEANTEDILINLENAVKSQFLVNENMKERVAELEEEIAALTLKGVHDLESGELFEEKALVNARELPEIGHLFSRAASSSTAFHAYRSTGRCYNDFETIVFDVEALDPAGVYDVRDGIFEPPVSGIYVFTWTAAAPVQRKFVTELVIGGRMAGVITTDSDITRGTGTGIHPATAVVVAKVNAGTHCYIRVRHTNGECVRVLSDANEVRTTFTGWHLF